VSAVAERPILMSPGLVAKTIAGLKSQTRRVRCCTPMTPGIWTTELGRCPYGRPGDLLWVRERFFPDETGGPPYYAADYLGTESGTPCEPGEPWRWKPSIHMPRWASRLTLEVTGVRVERLQDISEADALAEGVELLGDGWWLMDSPYHDVVEHGTPDPSHKYRYHFAALWDSINGKRPGCSWADNPWVWVVAYEIAWLK